MNPSGFLLFDKPEGRTSFNALAEVKKAFPGAKVGHTGTLDSFATGLLVLVVGSYGHLAPWFVGLDKQYEATIRFGNETDTLDPSGQTIAQSEVPEITAVKAALPGFKGRQFQVPPRYSAIRIQGARASDRIRRGEEIDIPPREILIHDLEIISWNPPDLKLSVHCSSGTYVRSLARDLALAIGARAHVFALRRIKVGPFDVSMAGGWDEGLPLPDLFPCLRKLGPEEALAMGLDLLTLNGESLDDMHHGRTRLLDKLMETRIGDGDHAVFDPENIFHGILATRKGKTRFAVVLEREGSL